MYFCIIHACKRTWIFSPDCLPGNINKRKLSSFLDGGWIIRTFQTFRYFPKGVEIYWLTVEYELKICFWEIISDRWKRIITVGIRLHVTEIRYISGTSWQYSDNVKYLYVNMLTLNRSWCFSFVKILSTADLPVCEYTYRILYHVCCIRMLNKLYSQFNFDYL